MSWWQDIIPDIVRLQALERLDLVDAMALQSITYNYMMEELGGIMGRSSGCLSQPRVVYEYPPAGAGAYHINIGAFQLLYTYPARRSDGELIQNEPPAEIDGENNAINPDAAPTGHSYISYDGEKPDQVYSGFYADDASPNSQTKFTHADRAQKAWKSVILTHDPSDSGQADLSRIEITELMATVNTAYGDDGGPALYTASATPYIWARPVIVDTDTDIRREWDVTVGSEQPISIATRSRVRVEFQVSATEPVVDTDEDGIPLEAPWVQIGRLWNWALGTRFSDGGDVGPQDPQLWPISAWDGAQMWRWVKTFGDGVSGQDDLIDETGYLGFPIPGAWLYLMTGEAGGNISASGDLMGGLATTGGQNHEYDDSDLGLVKILGLIRKQILKLNSWNEEYDWDTVGNGHSRGLVEMNVWVDEVWDRTGTELSDLGTVTDIDVIDDNGYLPEALDVIYAIARGHSFRHWYKQNSTLASAEYFENGLGSTAIGSRNDHPRLFGGHPIAYARMVWDPVTGDESLGYWWLLYSYNLELYSTAYDSGQSGLTYDGETVAAENWHKGLMNGGTGGPAAASDVFDARLAFGITNRGTFLEDQENGTPPRIVGSYSAKVLPNTDGAFGREDAYGIDDRFFEFNLGGGESAQDEDSNGLGVISSIVTPKTLWDLGGSGDPGIGNSSGYGPWHSGFTGRKVTPGSEGWGAMPVVHMTEIEQSRSVLSANWHLLANYIYVETTGPVMSDAMWSGDLDTGGGSVWADFVIPGMLGPSVPVACSFDIILFRHEDGSLLDEASASGDGLRIPSGGRFGGSFKPTTFYWVDDEGTSYSLYNDTPPFVS